MDEPISGRKQEDTRELRHPLDDPRLTWHVTLCQRERDALLLGLWCAQRDPMAQDMLKALGGCWVTAGLEIKLGGQVRWDARIRERLTHKICRGLVSLGLMHKPFKMPKPF